METDGETLRSVDEICARRSRRDAERKRADLEDASPEERAVFASLDQLNERQRDAALRALADVEVGALRSLKLPRRDAQ